MEQDEAAPEIPDWEWPVEVEAPLRTFFEREDVEAIGAALTTPDADIAESVPRLAVTLGADVGTHFRYVQRRIAFEPYAGSIRGAAGALRSGGGNALDRALLLRDLLMAAGHRARLIRGRLDWARAEELAGERPAERPTRGDPWLRRVEAASDHWWVEVRDGGSWTPLDTAFRDSVPGNVFGRRGEPVDSVPDRWIATARIELVAGDRRLAGVILPMPDVFGSALHVGLAPPESEANPEAEAGSEEDAGPLDESVEATEPEFLTPREEALAALAMMEEHDPLDRAPLDALLPGDAAGPVNLEIRAGGRVIPALPVMPEQLGDVRLRLDIEVPPGRHVRAALPFGTDPDAHLTVVLAGGAVRPAAYARQLVDLHAMMSRLLTVEIAALEAWRLRPREEDTDLAAMEAETVEQGPVSSPLLNADGEFLTLEDVVLPVHPAIDLHVEAIQAWREFAVHGTEILGLSLLAAAERFSRAVPVQLPDVRVVAINYRPANVAAAGELNVWLADPIQLAGAAGSGRAAAQSALGFLQSAVAGQVLNRLADRPPVTAYDLTLRAVGSGSRLSWFEGRRAPENWPASAAAVARADLDRGGIVVGPDQPIRRGGTELLAWWAMSGSGQASGRVLTPLGVAQAAVGIGPPVNLADLDSTLASLHDLHVAASWMLTLGDPDASTLTDLVPGACAATPLVADLLRAGAPEDFVTPAFSTFCRVQGPS